ncbi:MAG: tetratricopeptide repeat protein [Sandaracinus sp.]|nr:tetratricopeptide repeat protein [Sandaracinus sp.]MCB9619761.1 tetratricopeptide repeat protein [Sandaracinus sp.]MCB9623311.1 tetratricopeptide repeat protein [Sandaracinus sp.]MCB9633201.1 tetratricopeptide repeat protein [Sandaracinus sp.]
MSQRIGLPRRALRRGPFGGLVHGVPVYGVLAFLGALTAVGCGGSTPRESRPAMPDPLGDVQAEELYGHGAALAQQGDTVRAEQYVVAAIERGYPVGDALPLLIEVCVASNRLSSALSHAEPFLREHPGQWPLRHVVGTLYLGLGRVDDAQREFERVVSEAPDAAMPHFHLGMLLYETRGDRDAARPHLERYLELAPEGRHVAEARSVLTSRTIQRVERLDSPTDAPPEADANGAAIEGSSMGASSSTGSGVGPTEGSTPEGHTP